jgi:RNA polymerase sigma factor for flagellar operon FliA
VTSHSAKTASPPVPAEALRTKASQAYASQSRAAVEEQWILQALPLVRRVARKVASYVANDADMEDLISAGTVGLVKAARSYDPERHAEFRTYAYIRIRGAVLDELRGRTFVPAPVYAKIRKVRQAYQHLANEMGQPPTEEQLARHLGVPLAELYRLLTEARKQQFLSIHGLSGDASLMGSLLPADGAPGPAAELERKELRARLAEAIQQLPQRERRVIVLYYERELTMKEIAQVMEVTESRISQLHASALFKLNMKMGSGP